VTCAESGPALVKAFTNGVRAEGIDVINAGLGSTDLLYYASGILGIPGAMFTASHNPARYNGIKMCYAGAKPVGQDSGLGRITELADPQADLPAPTGSITERGMLDDYAAYLHKLVDLSEIRPLKVVVDAGNGMGGYTVPACWARSRRCASSRCTSSSTGRSPTTRPTRWSRPTSSTCRRPWSEHGADIGSPSTATPTGAS
jgi:phosphomannomutase